MSVRRLKINIPDDVSYEVRIGDGASRRLGAQLRECNTSERAVMIVDSTVAPLYGKSIRGVLEDSGYVVSDLEVPQGETSKSLAVAEELYNALALLGVGRDCLVVSLGGGVIGDLAGFVAATYMRGVDFAQVPTSLLAMVDASVGGKNAVNIEAGKNLVGTFRQPIAVCADTDFLASLPQTEWVCGLGEVAKSAIIGGAAFYSWLRDNVESLRAGDQVAASDAIAQCVAFKAGVVIKDVHEEAGVRECLNYGHTLGHALEVLAGYGNISHGLAVAEGMRFAARLAADVIDTPVDFVLEQDELLDSLGLASLDQAFDAGELCERMYADKKARGGQVRFVLPQGQGSWQLTEVGRDKLMEHLTAWQRSKEQAR